MSAGAGILTTDGTLGRARELILPIGIIACILVIMVPLPSALMDVLLSANITLAVIVLLTTIYVKTPLEFSVFPSMLLASTLFRLVLNVATTRLILTRAGSEKLNAAGGVIRTFGEFVAGNNVVVGIIIFAIIVLIQFIVITKGATRISEVAARFALDGMPGRQMAIDADLNAGVIDEREAQRRRTEITEQADFFGAMDGASKFVRGDAIAGIIITIINIVGGLIIGIVQLGMEASTAGSIFTKLTIGDGLVSQVPAFLVSMAAALLVTRSTQRINLPSEFLRQVFSHPVALMVSGGFLITLTFTSLPKIPLLVIAAGCFLLARTLTTAKRKAVVEAEQAHAAEETKVPETRIEDLLTIDPMKIELGAGLVRLASRESGGDLLERIKRIRENLAMEIGIILPKVRVRDNLDLDMHEYRIQINDASVAGSMVYPSNLLAIDSGVTTGKVDGIETTDPVFGTPAVWIAPGMRDRAELYGYSVFDAGNVIATHLTEVVRQHADELLTRDAAKHLTDELRATSPTVVDELVPKILSLAEVQQILQMLLRESVPIRQLSAILETLGDYGTRTKDPILLCEYVRHRLSRVICSKYRDAQNRLRVVTLDPALEDQIRAGVEHGEAGMFIRLSPAAIETVVRLIAEGITKLTEAHHPPVLLVSPQLRAAVRRITESQMPRLVVLSYNEITRDTQIESVAMVSPPAG